MRLRRLTRPVMFGSCFFPPINLVMPISVAIYLSFHMPYKLFIEDINFSGVKAVHFVIIFLSLLKDFGGIKGFYIWGKWV